MSKKEIIKSRLLVIISALVIASIWVFNVFTLKGYVFKVLSVEITNGILYSALALFILMLLLFRKDTFEVGAIFMMLPLSITQYDVIDNHIDFTDSIIKINFDFSYYTNIIVLVLFVGLVLHLIIYRPKFRLGSFSISLLLLLITMIVITIIKKNDLINFKDLLIIFVFLLGLFFIYEYYSLNNTTHSFKDISFILLIISLLIIGERIALYFINDISDYHYSDFGIILFAIPFIMYFLFDTNNVSRFFLNLIIVILLAFIIAYIIYVLPILSVIILISIIFVFIISIRKRDNRLIYSLSIVFLLLFSSIIVYSFTRINFIYESIITRFINNFNDIKKYIVDDLDTYKELINRNDFNKLIGISLSGYKEVINNDINDIVSLNLFERIYLSFGGLGLLLFFVLLADIFFKTLRFRTRQSITISIGFLGLLLFLILFPSINYLNIIIIILIILSYLEKYVNAKVMVVEGIYE